MTEQKQSDPAKAGEIAQQIVKILVNEDSETRRRAIQAAMMLLGEASSELEFPGAGGNDPADLAAFFNRDEKLKPSDYACLCAAYHFSMYGTAAFSLDDLRTIALDAGVVLPDRLDMTLKSAVKDGKKLFQAAGRNAYKPTASAGVLFKEQWGVKPGKRKKETATAKD
jgi:hypothetical protein